MTWETGLAVSHRDWLRQTDYAAVLVGQVRTAEQATAVTVMRRLARPTNGDPAIVALP